MLSKTREQVKNDSHGEVPVSLRKDVMTIKTLYMKAALEAINALPTDQQEAHKGRLKRLRRDLITRKDDQSVLEIKSHEDLLEELWQIEHVPENMGNLFWDLGLYQDLRGWTASIHDQVARWAGEERERTVLSPPFSTHSHEELLDLKDLQIRAVMAVVLDAADEAKEVNDTSRYERLLEYYHHLKGELGARSARGGFKGHTFVSKTDMKRSKDLPDVLLKPLVEAGLNEESVNKAFRRAQVQLLNDSSWKTVRQGFSLPGTRERDVQMTCTQTPACAIRVKHKGFSKKCSVFRTPYRPGSGVTCRDTTNKEHAASLWQTQFKVNGGETFRGVRHAILDPYKEPDKQLRKQGAQKRAEEALVAALASRPEWYQQALDAAEEQDEPPRIFLTSTSLVTAGMLTGVFSEDELSMQDHQNEAWDALLSRDPLEIEVPGPDGQRRRVRFSVELAKFNIPVNIGGVGTFERFTSGRAMQKRLNDPSIAVLVGGGSDVGGWCGDYLSALSGKLDGMDKDSPGYYKLYRKHRVVELLALQVKQIYRSGSHHSEGKDTYKLAARVAYLTSLIGGVPLYNCKSGKDRTGMLDAEIKFLAAYIERFARVPDVGQVDLEVRELFHKVLLHSGNLEVQKSNVGVRGYKTEMVKSIDQRIGDDVVRAEVRGLSGMVGS